jgi:nucleotide-binding universal stress UspA family protein
VTVSRGRPDPAPRVLCGVNGSTSSRRALAEAVRRAAACGGRLTVVTAYDAVGYFWGALASLPGGDLLPVPDRAAVLEAEESTLRAFVDDVLSDAARAALAAEGLMAIETRAVPGRPVDVLVRESTEAATLVVGHGKDSGSAGSVAAGCLRRAHCPVIVVPGVPMSLPAPPITRSRRSRRSSGPGTVGRAFAPDRPRRPRTTPGPPGPSDLPADRRRRAGSSGG